MDIHLLDIPSHVIGQRIDVDALIQTETKSQINEWDVDGDIFHSSSYQLGCYQGTLSDYNWSIAEI